jgi:hypothetical protein
MNANARKYFIVAGGMDSHPPSTIERGPNEFGPAIIDQK